MSDEIHNDGWAPVETGAPAAGTPPPPAGFCQDCGRPLTPEIARHVGGSLFCAHCLTARVGRPQPVPGDASPVLAGLLGIIPGVGAMYNGQYAKGFVHLAISAVLFSLHDGHGVLGLLSFGWFCYQILDAYQTARARRDGTPLPNPLGLNDIGERMGFGRTRGFTANGGPAQPPPQAATATPPVPPPASYTSGWPPPRTDWVGYVPPSTFASAPPVPPPNPATAAAAQQAPPWGHAPYSQTYTGGVPPVTPTYAAVPPVTPVAPLPPAGRLPVGALWLIGLGLLILLGNLLPRWGEGERWWPAIVLAGLSVWLFARRMRSGVRVLGILRWPVILMVLAIMFALHAAYFTITFGLVCAVLLIVFGGLLLLERLTAVPPPLPYSAPVVPPADSGDDAARARAAWAANAPETPSTSEAATNEPKDGQ